MDILINANTLSVYSSHLSSSVFILLDYKHDLSYFKLRTPCLENFVVGSNT